MVKQPLPSHQGFIKNIGRVPMHGNAHAAENPGLRRSEISDTPPCFLEQELTPP
jgi:hypothetical protein